VPTALGRSVHHHTIQFISNRRQGLAIAAFWGFEPVDVSNWSLSDGEVHWYCSRDSWTVEFGHELRWKRLGLLVGLDQTRFASGSGAKRSEQNQLAVGISPWLAAILLAALPAARMIRRYRRPGPGFCPVCRYDLTANTSGICPECGTPLPHHSAGAPAISQNA
jgi:hypothetical protein